ncbi:MAG TPA: hypothetical protein VJR27_00860 [Candidatus Saccharimonadales bacterium]|nr:hypothetical protein [Candidatus Saccharimonadales bacterium]
MKLLSPIPEAAMVAAFLKAEFTSERFGDELKKVMQKLSVATEVIVTPDIKDEHQNELRAKVLGDYRGYKQNRAIFANFPHNLAWYTAELSREEIGDLRYVDYSYWNELTNNTHMVKDAVKNIQQDKTVFDVRNDRFLAVAEKIRHGEHDFEPMILWDKSKDWPLTILEGHLRATAFGLAGKDAPKSILVIVGLADQLPKT